MQFSIINYGVARRPRSTMCIQWRGTETPPYNVYSVAWHRDPALQCVFSGVAQRPRTTMVGEKIVQKLYTPKS